MKKIIFSLGSNNLTPYSEHIPLASYLKDKGFTSTFLMDESYSESILKKILLKKHQVFINEKELKETSLLFSNLKNKDKKDCLKTKESNVKNKFKKLFPFLISINRLIINYRFLKRSILIIKDVFNRIKPDIVVLYGDRTYGFTPAIISYCKKKGIPIYDIEIAVSNLKFLAKNRMGSNYLNTNLNKLCAYLFKIETIRLENKEVFFYDWTYMAPMGILDLTARKPWYIGSNGATYFLRKSNVGQPHTNVDYQRTVETVGQFSLDKLFETYQKKEGQKNRLLNKYFSHINSYDKIIILALPQMYEHNLMSKEDAKECINYITNEISGYIRNLVFISLHPKMDYENYNYLDKHNVKVVKEERLNEILPIGDLFISCFESTIQWSILCEVVPIFLDYFNFGFDLSSMSSCQIFKDKDKLNDEFKNTIKNLPKIKKKLQIDKHQYLPFDGNAGARILHHINNEIINTEQI